MSSMQHRFPGHQVLVWTSSAALKLFIKNRYMYVTTTVTQVKYYRQKLEKCTFLMLFLKALRDSDLVGFWHTARSNLEKQALFDNRILPTDWYRNLSATFIIVIARIVCGWVCVMVQCPSICLSVPSVDHCSIVRRVCCWVPCRQAILTVTSFGRRMLLQWVCCCGPRR